jgi:protoporphyrinogen IX oxidase
MEYLQIKAIHIIFVTSWFAGLFYLPRLFVYHREAMDKPIDEAAILQAQFHKMESILYRAIMMPAMILTILSGSWMLYLNSSFLNESWMQLKLLFVLGLILYHFFCKKLLDEMHAGKYRLTSFQLRLWNEVATIFLFAIVFLVVLKNTIDWIWAIAGLIIFAAIIMTAVKIVRNLKNSKK